MMRVLIGILAFAVYLALVIWLAFALHFSGTRLIFFCVLLGLLGAATAAFFLWYLSPRGGGVSGDLNPVDVSNLVALLRDADTKVRQAGRPGVKSLSGLPLLYVVGDENSAKTQTILQSGLDPELLAGNVFQGSAVAPTSLANVWLTSSAALVEAGSPLFRQPGLWQCLVKATVPPHLGSALSSSKRLPARAIVVCVSIERILAPSTAEQIIALAQSLNQRLRELSQILGISLPVYVLFTKLDTVGSFGDFAVHLSEDEVRQPIGSLLSMDSSSGLYVEKAGAAIRAKFDQLVYALSEFRLDVLSRGTEIQQQSRAYEFPRDLGKLRAGILSFLVEIARPSQIGVNPFLRGFFFAGIRAHMVNDVLEVAAVQGQAAPPPPADGATRIFSFSAAKASAPTQAMRSRGTRKVPQWVFLPHLFSNILLADKSALDASRASTHTGGLRKFLLGTVSVLLLILLAFGTISFFRNRALAASVADMAAAPVIVGAAGSLPTAADLQSLDKKRAVLEQLHKYRTEGAPWLNRVGLDQSAKLFPAACRAYGAHFRSLLLTPAQRNIVATLRAVPEKPNPDDSYVATYDPLKAYLITTSNPNPDSPNDTTAFLPSALLAAWQGKNQADPSAAAVAQTQFATYARLLAQPDSCMAGLGGASDQAAVTQGQKYLANFNGIEHVYESMKAAANRKFAGFTYNNKYPNASGILNDSYPIIGAFTKDGFAFMQDAIQHPDPYFGGEKWVLGPYAGQQVDRASLTSNLKARYSQDFVATWRAYLSKASFSGYSNYADASKKLDVLTSPASPMLELFALISSNTAVSAPEIASQFQAPQHVVPPSLGNVLLAPANQPYIGGLQQLKSAIDQVAAAPNPTDPAVAVPVSLAAGGAENQASNLRLGFVPDSANLYQTSYNLLIAPIEHAKDLAAKGPKEAVAAGAKAFCAAAGPTFAKFPFNPSSATDAAPDDVAQIFAPQQGSFWQFYNNSLKSLVQQTGSNSTPVPGSAVHFGRGFLSFLNRSAAISQALFSSGPQPSLTFTLAEDKASTVHDAVLNIDGQQLAAAAPSTTFHWVAQPSSHVSLLSQAGNLNYQGTWSVLHFSYDAKHPGPNHLVNDFSVNGHSQGVAIYDISGPGALLLDPDFMHGFRCSTNPEQ
jgi:type VI secretion system protein ImpL